MKLSSPIRLLAQGLVLGGVLAVFSATLVQAESVTVINDGVNIRTGPGIKYPIYMEVFKGYPLKVLKRDGEWLEVADVDNDKGWIFTALTRKGDTVIVDAKQSANMRSGPGTDNPIIANVQRGVVMEHLDTKGDWYKLKHTQGTTGWMHKSLLWP
jgi:SH3-like domain-containing protein